MRTRLELPAELIRRARVAAAERGMTLREFVVLALERELAPPRVVQAAAPRRLMFPIFKSVRPGKLDLTNEDLKEIEAEEDMRRHGHTR